jgi:hypothetical protein
VAADGVAWRNRAAGVSLMGAVALAGCIGPRETQYLTLRPRPPAVEARSYDWHDPFPDEAIGPDTATRPRAFTEPRTDTRKNFDQSFLQAMHPTAGHTQWAAGPQIGPPGLVARPPVYAPVVNHPGPVAAYPWPTTTQSVVPR